MRISLIGLGRVGAAIVFSTAAAGASFVQCSGEDLSSARRTSTATASAAPPAAAPAPPAAAPSAPAEDGTCAGARVCDSFEDGTVGAPPRSPWATSPSDGGTVTVTNEKAYRGTQSVKLTTQAAEYQRAMIDATALFASPSPLPSNALYGRLMVWLEELPASDGVHWTMLEGVGPVPNQDGVTAYMTYGGQIAGQLLAGYDTENRNTDCYQHSATHMPTQRWVCVTFMLGGQAGQKSEMRLALDAADVGDLHIDGQGEGCQGDDLGGQWLAPALAKASFGWESYQQDVGHTMYIDDVALGESPIACP